MKTAVIGAGMAGLSAAIYARLNGHTVDVFEQHATPGGKIRRVHRNGYVFDMGPSIIIEPWIFREPFEKAGLACPLAFDCCDPLFSIWFEGHDPFVAPADFEAMSRLLREYAPEDYRSFVSVNGRLQKAMRTVRNVFFQKPIGSFADLMDPRLLRLALLLNPNQTAAAFVEQNFSSPVLRGILSTFPAYTEHKIARSPATALLAPFMMIQGGIFYPQGGIYRLAEAFAELALGIGVNVQYGMPVERVYADGGRFSLLIGRNRSAPYDRLISAIDYTRTQVLLNPHYDVSGLRPAHSYFAVAIGSNRTWDCLQHHTFVVPQDYARAHRQIDENETPDRPPVYLCTASKSDSTVAPSGKENIFAVTLVPSRVADGWATHGERFAERLIAYLEGFGLPGLRSSIETLEIMSPADIEAMFGNFGGSVFGLSGEFNPLFGFRPYNRDRHFPNLLYAGATVQPGGGVPLVIRSGKFAAELAGKARSRD
mgnify:CR=1 FL=1